LSPPRPFFRRRIEVDVLEREHRRLVHAKAVVVDQSEEGPIARGGDGREETVEVVLGEVLGEA
jgi:hypothetical protein